MPKRNKKQFRRLSNLAVLCTALSGLLVASTYAWFIGMQTVNVSTFEIEVASTESLLLSLDGSKWDTTLYITKENLPAAYTGNTNSWGGSGLIPMSSIGAMDASASRMKLFEKASLTPTPGGYRLMSSRVDNYTPGQPEQGGYVVFDLFVRNISGTQYIPEVNTLDEEAIYLTTNSEVKVAADGVPNTGIENSVRVAFAQIGRVIGTTTTPEVITGIDCAPDGEGLPSIDGEVTGICREARIWEPNDTKHVNNAISWYNTSCKARTGVDVTKAASYSGVCGTVANTNAYPTYAVGTPIASSQNVDIYDGLAYNTYSSSPLLISYPYFTDTHKNLAGTLRPLLMTLAPNSITKVRVYIYIEGQDVDNYDFASIGKKVTVNFGFTKQRFEPADIGYTGPASNLGTETVKPVITLLGNPTETVAVGGTYIDAGATAHDLVDGDLTTKIKVTNPVDTSKAGTYIIAYDVLDWAGNYAERVTRTVTVQ